MNGALLRGPLGAHDVDGGEVRCFLCDGEDVHPHCINITRDLDLINHIGLAPVVLAPVLEQQRERMEIVSDRHLADLVDRPAQALEILDVTGGNARQGALSEVQLEARHADRQTLGGVRVS